MLCIRSDSARRTPRHRWVPAVTALVVLSWACGDQGPSAPRPASIEVVSTQLEGPPGQPLAAPLIVRVLDAGGGPVPDVEVAFTTTHGGSFSPATTITGTDGRAQTIWTLGSAAGQQMATATVGTVTAQATAMATNPCDVVEPYTIGTQVNGTLTTASCLVSGYHTDRYRFTLAQQTTVRIDQFSQAFDTYVELYDDAGNILAFGSELEPNSPNSGLRAILPAGTYEVWPSTWDAGDVGAYSLNSGVIANPYSDCAAVWLRLGAQSTQTLSADCEVDIDATPHPAHVTYFMLPTGVGRTISQSATDGETILQVYQYNHQTGFVLLHDARSTPGAPATFNLPSGSGLYGVITAGGAPGATPTYTLGVQ
jgi:hypothetical protein